MIYKVYEKIKSIIKENYKFFIILTILMLICSIKLPFYINAPGGIININDRVCINNSYKTKGSFNLTYVSEIKATIPTILFSYVNKDWNLLKKDEVIYDNETAKDEVFRSHL